MTNYNKRLDEVLFNLADLSYASFTTQEEADRVADQLDYDRAEAKQAIISLITELVAEAKPKTMPSNLSPEDYEKCERVVNQYHQNILKALRKCNA